MEVQNFARSIDSSYSDAVPVQKAAYSDGRSAVMRVAATAGLMVVSLVASWVVGRVVATAGLMAVSMAASTAVQSEKECESDFLIKRFCYSMLL